MNYNTALNGCSLNGKLATWSSASEYSQMKAVRSDLGIKTWVGLDDIAAEGKWKFIDGDTSYCGNDCDNLPQWGSGEPNDAGAAGEDAAEMRTRDGLLNDQSVTDEIGYICEFDVSSSRSMNVDIWDPLNDGHPNYYILEFTSIRDMVTIFSILLNVAFIFGTICYFAKANGNKSSPYSKVKIYASEDEQL